MTSHHLPQVCPLHDVHHLLQDCPLHDVHHLLQDCPLHDVVRPETGPKDTSLRDKLFGNSQALQRTASCVQMTDVSMERSKKEKLHPLVTMSPLQWISAHYGIQGNGSTSQHSKDAVQQPPPKTSVLEW